MDKSITHSYCVFPDKVYAGEYARDKENPQWKVNRLEMFGIKKFIKI